MQLAKRQARRVSRQGFQPHLGGAFAKTSHTARTIKRDGVALGRHDVGSVILPANFADTGPILSAMATAY
jgi:hypothetical protein